MTNKIESLINALSSVKLEIVSFIIALFIPTITGLMFIGLFIFADTLTGIWKIVKTEGWKGVKSRPLSDGLLPKLFMYPLILLVASGCHHIFPDVPFIRSAIFLLMCIEIKSLTENINVILKINFFEYIRIFLKDGNKGIRDKFFGEDKKEDETNPL